MADAMSQDSDTGLTAEQLDAKYGESQDAATTPPKDDEDDTPAWIDEAAAILNKPAGPPANNPPAAAPGAMAAALLPIRSESSQLVEQMGALAASAPSAAAAPDKKPAGPSQSGAPGGKPGDQPDDSSTDDSDDDELTPEQKMKAELLKNINEVVARAKAQGYTFSSRSETTAAAAFLDDKELFDQAAQDITDCASDNKKISLNAVNKKITELRAAEAASLVVAETSTASQLDLADDDSDEGEEEEQQFNPHKDKTLAQIKPLLIDAKGDNPNPLTL